MSQLRVHGPFEERDAHDDLRPHPVRANARQPRRLCERCFLELHSVEAGAKLRQQSRIESGADLSGEDEVVSLEVADEQRPEPHASALPVGEAAHNKVLRELTLHFEPVL